MKEPDISIFTDLEKEVLNFAKTWHKEQVRKYTNEPYWFHLVNVATLVKEYGHPTDMVCAALLHDILEDTLLEQEDLYEFLEDVEQKYCDGTAFAFHVSNMVHELTDWYTFENFPILNRKERKQSEAIRLGECMIDSQTIKYCDLIDNTSSIVTHDPRFAEVYLNEKAFLLDCMVKGDKELRRRAMQQLSLHHH